MNLLGSKEQRKTALSKRHIEEDSEQELTVEEIVGQIRNLKTQKATEDQIPNEAWIYSTGIVTERLTEVIPKVWKGKGIPDGWKKDIIYPLYKKGETEEVSNYRGIILLNSTYKIYAAILNKRIADEIEKGMLPEIQAGFRKNKSVVDNIVGRADSGKGLRTLSSARRLQMSQVV